MGQLKTSAQAVQDALSAAGVAGQVTELPASTRTAAEAAAAVGCSVAQIAKSLIFQGASTGKPVLVIASGVNRVDEQAIAERIGEPVRMADPAFVRSATGFAIGGVPPCGHPEPINTLIDRDLYELETLWAAAGTPNAVFRLTPGELTQLTTGVVARVTG